MEFNLEGSSAVHPSISPDGKRLYFASDRPNGYGGMDLYYVTIVNNQFSTPVNLGPDVNTAGDEVFPYSFDHGAFILFVQRKRWPRKDGHFFS